jgi:hypothetical protein
MPRFIVSFFVGSQESLTYRLGHQLVEGGVRALVTHLDWRVVAAHRTLLVGLRNP